MTYNYLVRKPNEASRSIGTLHYKIGKVCFLEALMVEKNKRYKTVKEGQTWIKKTMQHEEN